MKTNKLLLMTFLGLGCLCSTQTFSQSTDPRSNNLIKKTFTYEINAQTTLDELKEIEKMLNEKYNIYAKFIDVSIQNNLIQSVTVELKTKNQQISKSIRQNIGTISPFGITVTDNNGMYFVSIENNFKEHSIGNDLFSFDRMDRLHNYSESNEKNTNFSFDFFEQFQSVIPEMFNDMNQMQNEIKEMFKKLESNPESKEEIFKEENETTTATLSEK